MIRRQVARSLFWRRIQAGLLQRELAERASVDPGTVQRAERGTPQRVAILRRIAAALDVTPDELQQPPPELPELKQPQPLPWSRRSSAPGRTR